MAHLTREHLAWAVCTRGTTCAAAAVTHRIQVSTRRTARRKVWSLPRASRGAPHVSAVSILNLDPSQLIIISILPNPNHLFLSSFSFSLPPSLGSLAAVSLLSLLSLPTLARAARIDSSGGKKKRKEVYHPKTRRNQRGPGTGTRPLPVFGRQSGCAGSGGGHGYGRRHLRAGKRSRGLPDGRFDLWFLGPWSGRNSDFLRRNRAGWFRSQGAWSFRLSVSSCRVVSPAAVLCCFVALGARDILSGDSGRCRSPMTHSAHLHGGVRSPV